MQSVVQISEFFDYEKIPISYQQSNILQEIISRQENDFKSENCNEENTPECSNRDILKCIVSDSYFSLYLDNFSNRNLTSLYIKDIS